MPRLRVLMSEPMDEDREEHNHEDDDAQPHQDERTLFAWCRFTGQRRNTNKPMQSIENFRQSMKDDFRRAVHNRSVALKTISRWKISLRRSDASRPVHETL